MTSAISIRSIFHGTAAIGCCAIIADCHYFENSVWASSETIYSPASLTAFTDAIVALMGRVKTGKTMVAAKRVYFGVGGSVDGFREACAQRGCVAYEMEFEGLGDGSDGGVRRCLVEVQMY